MNKKVIRPRLTEKEYEKILDFRQGRGSNVLVIGDLHAPFIKKGYLEFCIEMHEKHNCKEVVFIGDLIDNHFSSYHETDPDGFGGAEELRRAKIQIADFYKAFPNAKVCIGNHDALPNRKAFSSGVSKQWIKSIGEVLDTPMWEYAEEFMIDRVLYTHGIGRKARQRCVQEMMSVVQGHYHSESYVEYFVSPYQMLFALQIGCGVDRRAYGLTYGKHFKKPQLNVGIVKDNGRYAIIEPMPLE